VSGRCSPSFFRTHDAIGAVRISALARQAGIAPSAVRWYEAAGIVPAPERQPNGYRDFGELDLARLRLVVALRRLGLGPQDAGRLARLCLERGAVDADLAPILADQRAAIARQRRDLDRLEAELLDLESTIQASGRARRTERSAEPIRVLFVCTHNSARSQIAEALLRRLGGGLFEVRSAGTEPGAVNPFAVRILGDLGIDWSMARSKPVGPFLGERWDYVITLCDTARARCPAVTATNVLHWGLDDPAEAVGSDDERLAAFRRTEREIASRLAPFVEVALRAADRNRPVPVG
jgi:arsenate reductase (thioredoxin)